MRSLGWVPLIGGFLLCLSIRWAALGFLSMGFGLVLLQIAERKNKSPVTSGASHSPQSDPQREPLPPRVLVRSEAEERGDVVRESAISPGSYDKESWRFLLRNDADISRLVTALAPYGQKYVDELAAAYLALNDKDHLPVILREIIASARRDSSAASNLSSKISGADADGLAFGRTRRADRVRYLRGGYADGPASLNDDPKIDPGLEKEQVSKPSARKFRGDVDASAARNTAVDETNLKPVGAPAESNVSAARPIAAEAAAPKPPTVTDATAGPSEKKGTREVDAVDADDLAEILNRLSPGQVPTSKTE